MSSPRDKVFSDDDLLVAVFWSRESYAELISNINSQRRTGGLTPIPTETNMPKKQAPSQTSLRKVLAESAFDPRVPGPLKVIADNDNVFYLTERAIEFVREGQQGGPTEYEEGLTKAIGLLALAKLRIRQ